MRFIIVLQGCPLNARNPFLQCCHQGFIYRSCDFPVGAVGEYSVQFCRHNPQLYIATCSLLSCLIKFFVSWLRSLPTSAVISPGIGDVYTLSTLYSAILTGCGFADLATLRWNRFVRRSYSGVSRTQWRRTAWVSWIFTLRTPSTTARYHGMHTFKQRESWLLVISLALQSIAIVSLENCLYIHAYNTVIHGFLERLCIFCLRAWLFLEYLIGLLR